jgi:sulfatase modifying factor 1
VKAPIAGPRRAVPLHPAMESGIGLAFRPEESAMPVRRPARVLLAAVLLAVPGTARALVDVALAEITLPRNAGDDNGWGNVDYVYSIGLTEVTNEQYVEFLNAVADADPNGLYDTQMATLESGGITRSGSSGSYVYALKGSQWADKPVVPVSWYDAARFANWLHNGQPTGAQGPATTEIGSYDLTGVAIGQPVTHRVGRNAGATWALPKYDEWYKAAYHYQSCILAVCVQGFRDYPLSGQTTAPVLATCNGVGEVTNTAVDVANYGGGCNWNGSSAGNVSSVAQAGYSGWGTFDQGGNAAEWIEDWYWYDAMPGNEQWLVRAAGGSFGDGASYLTSTVLRGPFSPYRTGFRLVSLPEPGAALGGSAALAALASLRRLGRQRERRMRTRSGW